MQLQRYKYVELVELALLLGLKGLEAEHSVALRYSAAVQGRCTSRAVVCASAHGRTGVKAKM